VASLRSGVLRVLLAAFVMSAVSYVFVRAQTRTPAEHLEAGIAHLAAGDVLRGLMTLNEVIEASSGADAGALAKAHAYRAQAYLELNDSTRAWAAAVSALDAQPDIPIATPPFSTRVVALFGDARQQASLQPEAAGNLAEKSGRVEDALRAYLRAYQSLPDPVPADDDRRLRERIIEVALALPEEPAIPAQARAHLAKATELLEAEAVLGPSASSSVAAAAELRRAIRLAPWWAEATVKLAGVLQKLGRVDEALLNLNLYRIADPLGYSAALAAKAATTVTAKPSAPVSSSPAAAVAPVAAKPATLFVFWPPQKMGGGRPKVFCGGHHVADLQARHYVALSVAPGARDIGFHNKSFPFSFEAGGTYYLRASAEGFPPKANVRLVSAAEGAGEMRDKGMTTNDPRRTYSPDCISGKSRR
jgi:tetratricopeptide (TPR) repeat protein